MTSSKLWKLLLVAFMVIVVVTWVLNQLQILSYAMSAITIALLTAGLFFAAGSKLQQMDIEKQLKQQKRDEHERIARLMNDEMEDTSEYGQEIPASTHYTRARKPF